jgi:2-amino-4-hydroxy-6-hydroxymethyldihydropteridine diphosphokinase
VRVFVGIGSNVQPRRNVESACRRLARDARVEALSRPWWTPAVGSDGPPFLNCVAVVESPFGSAALRRWLRDIEEEHGRVRTADRNAPRTLDLDVLATGDSDSWRFEADLDAEPYNLLPLADLMPDLRLPDGRTAREHAQEHPLPAAVPLR